MYFYGFKPVHSCKNSLNLGCFEGNLKSLCVILIIDSEVLTSTLTNKQTKVMIVDCGKFWGKKSLETKTSLAGRKDSVEKLLQ